MIAFYSFCLIGYHYLDMSMMPRVRTIRKVFKVMFAVMMILSLVASVALPFLQF